MNPLLVTEHLIAPIGNQWKHQAIGLYDFWFLQVGDSFRIANDS